MEIISVVELILDLYMVIGARLISPFQVCLLMVISHGMYLASIGRILYMINMTSILNYIFFVTWIWASL